MNSVSQGSDHASSGNVHNPDIIISFDKANSHKIPFPPVGFCRLSRLDQLAKAEIEALSLFNFSFYTILINLFEEGWKDEFRKANSEAKGLKIPLQVILHFGFDIETEIKDFIELCNSIFPFVEEVILMQKDHHVTPPGLLHKVLSSLREGLHHVKIGVGGFRSLEEIVQQKPDLTEADFLTIPFQTGIHPETLNDTQFDTKHQIEQVHSLKSISHSVDIYVTPMSLNAGLTYLAADPSVLFVPVNKIVSYLAASGKAISDFKSLIFSGVNSISFYENGGKTEVFTADHSSTSLEKINSIPFFYLLREVLEMNNGFIIKAANSCPSDVDSFVFTAGGKVKVMLINLTQDVQKVVLTGISMHARIINHDSTSIKEALVSTGGKTENTGHEINFLHGNANIELQPYGIALIHE